MIQSSCDLAAARGAVLDLLDLGDQGLLGEPALVGLAQRSCGRMIR